MKRSIPAITSEPSVDESMPAIASEPSATVTKALWQFKGTTVLVMFFLIVIGSALTYLFASRALKPLEDLTARVQSDMLYLLHHPNHHGIYPPIQSQLVPVPLPDLTVVTIRIVS